MRTHPVFGQCPVIDYGLGDRVYGESSYRNHGRRGSVDGINQVAFTNRTRNVNIGMILFCFYK